MSLWINNNKPLILPIKDLNELDEYVRSHWLTEEGIRFYALVIGEGWRFPQAKQLFWEQFDCSWRKALGYVSNHSSSLDQASIDLRLDHQLLNRLKHL